MYLSSSDTSMDTSTLGPLLDYLPHPQNYQDNFVLLFFPSPQSVSVFPRATVCSPSFPTRQTETERLR
ncbi:hypothetical protein CRENBAI_025177 [Crenichthys baileyi]|uniref:Uncharacterized protein n=1 Tax=Crenichthys baileyi TaxID=28760 RepID=A0AAV9RW30_9TELE